MSYKLKGYSQVPDYYWAKSCISVSGIGYTRCVVTNHTSYYDVADSKSWSGNASGASTLEYTVYLKAEVNGDAYAYTKASARLTAKWPDVVVVSRAREVALLRAEK